LELDDLPDDAISRGLKMVSTLYFYNRWIFDSVRDHLGPAILEVGAGVGNITQFLLNAERVVCLEPFEPYRQYMTQRFAQHLNVRVHPHPIEDCPNEDVPAGAFDSVVCLNVLEHIEDEVNALRRMREALRPGGKAVVLTPAMPCLYGRMDRALGHVRRHKVRSLRRAFHQAGLEPVRGRYMNMVGALGWWWQGRIRRKATVSQAGAGAFNRMVPILSALERLIPVPFGQSVILVGQA